MTISRRLQASLVLGAVFGLSACGSTESGNATGGSTSAGGASNSGGANQSGGATNPSGGATSATGGSTVGGVGTGGAGGGAAGAGGAGKGNFGCPVEKPAAGAECTRQFGACTYGDDGCVCTDGAWSCYTKADCPATAPAAAAACELGGMACAYGDLNCTCSTMNGWSCQTPCPQQQPAMDAACRRPANSTCRYAAGALAQGMGSMADTTCACSDEKFTCFSQDDCPAAAPTSGGACVFPTLGCTYPDSRCTCDSDGAWSCVSDCPDMLPADATACERPEQPACRYNMGTLVQGGGMTSDATCTCRNMQFDCVSQADCPATAPADASACADLNGLSCTYPDQRCTCDGMSWGCQTNCPAAPPAAATMCLRSANQPCRYAGGALIMGGGMSTAADNTCVCLENAFACYTAADCPATAPMSDTACDKPALSCAFGAQSCRCSTTSQMWSCFTTPGGMGGMGGMGNTAGAPGSAGMMSVGGASAGGASTGGTGP